MNNLLSSSIWFWRSFRKGDWLWLVIAIIVASMSVTLIKHIGDSIERSMLAKASQSLGADLVVQSTRPIDETYQTLATAMNLQTRTTISVVTMALSETDPAHPIFQLITLKGASDAQPLSSQNSTQALKQQQQSHSVWVDPKLLPLLQTDVGRTLTLGNHQYQITQTLDVQSLSNPLSQFAPQAQLRLDDFHRAGLLGPGSRATYELQVSGNRADVLKFQKQIQQTMQQDSSLPWTLISAQAPSEDLGKTLERAWFFLDLASLSAVLIAGMSILIASRFYLNRWQNSMALLRAFGANNRQMFQLFAGQLLWLSLFSATIGASLGLLITYSLQPLLTEYFDPFVMSPPLTSFTIGILSGVLVLWSFAWNALSESLKISPMRILRSVPKTQNLWHWLISFGLLVGLISLMIGTQWLHWVLIGLIGFTLLLWLGAFGLIKLLELWQTRLQGWQKIAISNLLKEKQLLSLQVISIGMVLFVLMLMTFVRQDLLNTWHASLPEQTPNVFVMNVQPDQAPQVTHILQQAKVQAELIPMVKGRLIAKNHQPIELTPKTQERGQRLLQREANIAILETLPQHNTLFSQVSASSTLPNVSVEEGIAKLFQLQLGDTLSFDFEGTTYDYHIDSIRKVEWQSFQLNFFFILQTPIPENLSISYITNFYLDPKAKIQATNLTQELAQQTPGVLLIDVQAIISQIQEIIAQASFGVSGLYLFTLIASLLVLISATLASQQSRLQTWFLLRSLGATQNTITKIGLSEFILVGILSGILAASFAQAISWTLGYIWFEQISPFSLSLWITTIGIGAGILIFIAWFTQKTYLKLSALQLKRLIQNH